MATPRKRKKKASANKHDRPSALARALRERDEALAFQAATEEILAAIRRSPSDAGPVFDAIVNNVPRLFGTRYVAVFLVKGDELYLAAGKGDAELERRHAGAFQRFREAFPQRIDYGGFTGKALASGKVSQMAPVIGNPRATPQAVELARSFGYNAMLIAPLMLDGKAIGAIGTTRPEGEPFDARAMALFKAFAAQAVIAIENARLFNETKEALEQQTATGDILRVIAGSPSQVQPVFDAIVRSALRLVGGTTAHVTRLEGDALTLAAFSASDAAGEAALKALYPMQVEGTPLVEVVASGAPLIVADAEKDPRIPESVRRAMRARGVRGVVVVPMMRNAETIGTLVVNRARAGDFSDRDIRLLKAFADQAVIAIENARLFNETKEALERQTATAEILKVISSSPTDTQPVFDAIVRSAASLFDPCNAAIVMREGGVIHLRAMAGPQVAEIDLAEMEKIFPLPFDPATVLAARTMAERRITEVLDIEAPNVLERVRRTGRAGRYRSLTLVPLVREGEGIGAIVLTHPQPGFKLTEKQLDLVRTFADQAVIAIENVRLLNETKEALERQTATAEILTVISNSPTDVQPVFDAIVTSAVQLCGAVWGAVFRFNGETQEFAASHNVSAEAVDVLRRRYPARPSRDATSGRAILERRVIAIPDVYEDSEYNRALGMKGGWRRQIGVPMVKRGVALGAIVLSWREPGSPHPSHEKLLQTFADQAAIAIDNVRLFNETKEALERETATSDVLRVISSSPTNVQPALDSIAERAANLCHAKLGFVARFDGKLLHMAAFHGASPEALQTMRALYPIEPAAGGSVAARVVRSGMSAQIADVLEDAEYSHKEAARAAGFRSALGVPLRREGQIIGAIIVVRAEAGVFPDKQVELLETFADQAVIAIENARLFTALQERNRALMEALEQQTATSEILKVISSSPTDVQPVFGTIIRNCVRLGDASFGSLFHLDAEGRIDIGAHHNFDARTEALFRTGFPHPVSPDIPYGKAMIEGAAVNVPDFDASAFSAASKERARTIGTRAVLAVPLMRQGRAIGAIAIGRREPGAFADAYVSLIRTFADQAVIAIENVRLFNETKEALEQQKASADVLGVISNSIADTKPVFDKILESCERLFEGHHVGINLVADDDLVHLAAYHGRHRAEFEKGYPVPLGESGTGAAIRAREVMHYADLAGSPDVPAYARRNSAKLNIRSAMFAPMLWEDRGVGSIFVGRELAGPFSQKSIQLLKTFADQAVIAIQNARLFREIQEKSAQLEVANKHKSDFLANMSHELRTPLNAIIGFSEVLLEKMFGEVNEKQVEYLRDIHESGRHLLSLINDILDLSKIEAGRMELELSTFHLPGAVSNAMTLVRERAQRHGIALGSDIDPALGEFEADERKVKQILLNLLSNAVKFTPDGGRVDVTAKAVNGGIEIEVRDTGIGIAPEDHAAVFEEFKQVGRDYTRKAEGTGLGLALTKRLVELHGGEVALESVPGKGSTFTVRLPFR